MPTSSDRSNVISDGDAGVSGNPNGAWKEFGASEVTHSIAHYLMTLRDLRATRGYARVTDLADALGVTKGTVSGQVRALREKGWVEEDRARHLRLTDAGEDVARQVLYNRGTLIRFLNGVLEVGTEQAEVDACKIEHLLSPDAGRRLLELVQLVLSDTPCAIALRQKYAGRLSQAGPDADAAKADDAEKSAADKEE